MNEMGMDARTSLRYETISAWCGPLFVLIFVVGFGWLGKNLPRPVSPAASAVEIAAHYVNHLSDLRPGWLICLVLISLYMPWSA